MPLQDDYLGVHPPAPHIFDSWFTSTDHEPVANRIHRALVPKLQGDSPEIAEWLGRKIIEHHYSAAAIDRLKDKFSDLGFPQYAQQLRQIPVADRTRKGNATEIILLEYAKACKGQDQQIHTYRLQYNPNVDQAMKGDDVLLVQIFKNALGQDELKVTLGEAKFRGIPNSEVLSEINEALSASKLPLSYTFLIQRLYEKVETISLAKQLENFLMSEVKAQGNLSFVALLLSNHRTGPFVEANFTSSNPKLVIVSAGIPTPGNLIQNAFTRAQELLDDPNQI